MTVATGSFDALIGRFTWDPPADHWRWSTTMYELHGYDPEAAAASTALWLEHKHPNDRRNAAEQLAAAASDPDPFSHYHRIITVKGSERTVLAVHHGQLDDTRHQVTRRIGFMVDVTDDQRNAIRDAFRQLARHRAVIEQAKGMVMLGYRVDADQAFALLRWHSNQHNIKLHLLAHQLVHAVSDYDVSSTSTRQSLDQLLFNLPESAALPHGGPRSALTSGNHRYADLTPSPAPADRQP
jgi:hypothetical protein